MHRNSPPDLHTVVSAWLLNMPESEQPDVNSPAGVPGQRDHHGAPSNTIHAETDLKQTLRPARGRTLVHLQPGPEIGTLVQS